MCGRWLAQIAMAFLHDLYGRWQVCTICHHDLCFIADSRGVLDNHWPLARFSLMTLHYLRSQNRSKEALSKNKAKISIVL